MDSAVCKHLFAELGPKPLVTRGRREAGGGAKGAGEGGGGGQGGEEGEDKASIVVRQCSAFWPYTPHLPHPVCACGPWTVNSMQSWGTRDGSKPIEINSHGKIFSIAFTEDGKQVLSGGTEGFLRRWQVDDGREVEEAIQVEGGGEILSAALSPDRKRLVCGLGFPYGNKGEARLGVWDAQTREKVLDIHDHTKGIFSVDVSPDSTKLATGARDKLAFIWSMTTGEQLVGPLRHDGVVVTVRFSPNGDRLATAVFKNPGAESIRIYKSDNGHQLLDIPFAAQGHPVSALTWSAGGLQIFAIAFGEVKCFDTSSGALLSKWSVHNDEGPTSIVLACNQKFVVVSASDSLSFWDTSTHKQIGTVVKQASTVWSMALSSNDDRIAIGEDNGKITFRGLRDILPASYFMVNLPLMYISDTAFKSWTEGNLTRVEQLLTEEILHPFHQARALAQRALVRTRLKQWSTAVDDAKKSVTIQSSLIGRVALAMSLAGSGEYESAIRDFDLVFSDGLPVENRFLLLIKAIILFECGKHEDAISRVDGLISIVDDQSPYITVRAQMYMLLGNMSMREGNNERAIDLFKRMQEAAPFQQGPHLVVISLMFGWDFDRLALAIQSQLFKAMCAVGHTEVAKSLSAMVETLGEKALKSEVTVVWDPDIVQRYLATFERNGDAALQSDNAKEAVVRYSTALCLNPSNPAGLLVKRSKARAKLGLWEDALMDADEAIKANPTGPLGYERRHAAFHGVRRYDEAIDAFTRMLSLIEESVDQDLRRKKYVSPSQSKTAIESVVRGVSKICPIVLIDVKCGRLCDGPERMDTFKSESQFKELVSSMTERLDDERILRVVVKYFQYVTFSHVWAGKEPSFQDVNSVSSVWDLDSSPLNEKLKRFCKLVRKDEYRWAWSDTCCIDKTISTVLNQSLMMMYKWYQASAATFVLLADVDSPSALGNLTDSKWMTRAWTAQELLAAKVIRFYDSNWKPYLGDTSSNHKESPEIMKELADAIRVARETIVAFKPDDLSVREKLRLASTRNATVEEDIAYSLIGIFKSDIRPHYGEGEAALGHLLEEIVARSGEVTVLAWTGKSSPYNSCLPATLAVYSQPPYALPSIESADMDVRVAALRNSLPRVEAMLIHNRIAHLPPPRFAHRRLHLPCIVFAVKRLGVQDFGSGQETRYRAWVSGIGYVDFQTSDRLSLTEPRRLIFVHPWIRDLRDPLDGFTWGGTTDESEGESDSDTDSEAGSSPTSPLQAVPAASIDDYTRALRLVVRLQQPFHALLLQQQPNGEFKRIAAEHEIVIPGLEDRITFSRDIHVDVMEVL
ncbi:hypothetical protein OG21DRAFT_1482770 [Imleria badia]|nr:hypothetical protein OG21DRAFT_1482770 [Imleria badia]